LEFERSAIWLATMAAGSYGDKTLQNTPTWAVAAVCAVFVVLSVLIEHGIQSLGKVSDSYFGLKSVLSSIF